MSRDEMRVSLSAKYSTCRQYCGQSHHGQSRCQQLPVSRIPPPLITIVTASSTACIAAWLITGCTTLHKGKQGFGSTSLSPALWDGPASGLGLTRVAQS
ncbi:hypothetical protein ACSS6W_000735 [Trichoderma asperelloides]